MERGESGAVIGGNLERRRHQEQAGALLEEALADRRRRFGTARGERPIADPEHLEAGAAEKAGHLLRLAPPARRVDIAIVDLLDATRPVGEEEHVHRRAGPAELGDQAAAAQHLVVEMRRQHERPDRLDGGRLPRGLRLADQRTRPMTTGSPRWRQRIFRTSSSILAESRRAWTLEAGESCQTTPTSLTTAPRRRASQTSSTS